MQLTKDTVDLYKEKAPELLDAVASGESEYIMKRDPDTDYCVKFDSGWCGIHASKGDGFLGDACHFYPRATRKVGEQLVMTASMSCPEITREVLFSDAEDHFRNLSLERLPFSLKSYEEEGITSEQMLSIHTAYLEHVMTTDSPVDRILLEIRSVAASLEMLSKESWGDAIPFYLRQASARIEQPEAQPSDDFNVLNLLCTLIHLSKVTHRPRLEETVNDMLNALHCQFDDTQLTLALGSESGQALSEMKGQWALLYADQFAPILKRWIYAQLSISLYPFSGLGENFIERTSIIAIRYATLRLALMSLCMTRQEMPAQDEVVRVVQSLSRFLDHLADPTASLVQYQQLGWLKESRLAGLLLHS